MLQKAYSLEGLRLAAMQSFSPLSIPLSPTRKSDTDKVQDFFFNHDNFPHLTTSTSPKGKILYSIIRIYDEAMN